ncbi:P-type conjugative transfer protein TrbG [Glycocaulis profundi]|nr:P-type conjugative transfer protein TrbG [Glycocaulis profundi]
MLRLTLPLTGLALVAACASAPPPADLAPDVFVAAAQIEEPDDAAGAAEPESDLTPPSLPDTDLASLTAQRRAVERAAPIPDAPPEEAIRTGRAQALIEPSLDGYVNAIQVYAYVEGALYRLYASPGQVSDIALQAGEALVSVSSGDTVRWVVGDTVSGAGPSRRAHVLVKPISPGIRTNLMIATDRRTYHLELESVASGYMAALSWRYPAEELSRHAARTAEAAPPPVASVERGLSVEGLNFDYALSGDSPAWRPVRVFDDGRQVFIQMPADIAASELPPLFVLGEGGASELVNYRVRGHYYVVDRLFQAAELRLGQRRQTVVRITRGAPRTGLAAWFGG